MIPIILTKKEKLVLGILLAPVAVYFMGVYLVLRICNK